MRNLMDKQQANDLANAIQQDAPWITTVTVQLAQEECQDTAGGGLKYVCSIREHGLEIAIKSFGHWIQLVESGQLSLLKKPVLPAWATLHGEEQEAKGHL